MNKAESGLVLSVMRASKASFFLGFGDGVVLRLTGLLVIN